MGASRRMYTRHAVLSSGRTQLEAVELFACFCIVGKFEKENSLENLHYVLFCLIEKRSVQLSVCFGSFLRTRTVSSVSDFFLVEFLFQLVS